MVSPRKHLHSATGTGDQSDPSPVVDGQILMRAFSNTGPQRLPDSQIVYCVCPVCSSGVSWHRRCWTWFPCLSDSVQLCLSSRHVVFFAFLMSRCDAREIYAASASPSFMWCLSLVETSPLELYYVVARQQSDLKCQLIQTGSEASSDFSCAFGGCRLQMLH